MFFFLLCTLHTPYELFSFFGGSFSADYTFAFEPIVLLLPDKLQQSHAFRWVSYEYHPRSRRRFPAFQPPLALGQDSRVDVRVGVRVVLVMVGVGSGMVRVRV